MRAVGGQGGVLGCVVSSKQGYVGVLTPNTSEWDLIWTQGLYRSNRVALRSLGVGLSPILLASLSEGGKFGQADTERKPHGKELPEARQWPGTDPYLQRETRREHGPACTLIWTLSCQNLETIHFYCVSLSVCPS